MTDMFKWLCIVALLILAGFANYFCCDYNLLYRILIDIFIFFFVSYLVLLTDYGRLSVVFVKESYLEVKKVIWPTFQESLYTTFIVIVVTVVMSLLLWSLDGVLFRIVSLSLRL